jgi:hypothetical protein
MDIRALANSVDGLSQVAENYGLKAEAALLLFTAETIRLGRATEMIAALLESQGAELPAELRPS